MAKRTREEAARTRQDIIVAARRVFYRHGVSRTSLEKIAAEAGVTRGAIYWHFADKTALFFAMRDASHAAIHQADLFLESENIEDPLEAIEQSIGSFLSTLENNPDVRETFEIMCFRCEYVDDFVPLLHEVNQPLNDFLSKLKLAYKKAAKLGTLRAGLDPDTMALESVSFAQGLFRNWISSLPNEEFRQKAQSIIAAHVALRRAVTK